MILNKILKDFERSDHFVNGRPCLLAIPPREEETR